MHEMRTIVVDDPGICQSVMWLYCTNIAEQIKVLFRVESLEDPRHIVLDGVTIPPTSRGRILPIE